MQVFSKIKCTNADDEGVLTEGGIYTVAQITEKGNIRLFEFDPPPPYTSFSSHRFLDTGDSVIDDFPDCYNDAYSIDDLLDEVF